MDSGLVLRRLGLLENSVGGIAESLQMMAESLLEVAKLLERPRIETLMSRPGQ
jgi:hypothetical protein